MFYTKNLPHWERNLRVLAGLVLLAIAFALDWTMLHRFALALTGLITSVTGFFGFCPMCALLGRRQSEEADAKH